MYPNKQCVIVFVLLVVGLAANLHAQQQEIKIKTIPLADNVYMLMGAGGNLGLSVGDDGALLVDSEYAPLTEKVLAAVKAVSDTPIRFVINTHWHFDHVGGNENLAQAGALIVAHENVRKRMSAEQTLGGLGRTVPPSPAKALPVITFSDALTFHWNGDEVRVIHVNPAHTDGDSFVYFPKANVLHVADVWFNNMYPFIDVNAGGSIDGMIKAADRALALANEKTKIIPGHGPLGSVVELREYRQMLVTVRDRVRTLVDQGKTRDEVIASKPTKDLDEKWAKAFAADAWIGIVYDGMTKD